MEVLSSISIPIMGGGLLLALAVIAVLCSREGTDLSFILDGTEPHPYWHFYQAMKPVQSLDKRTIMGATMRRYRNGKFEYRQATQEEVAGTRAGSPNR